MRAVLGSALIAAGLVLLSLGARASDSFASGVTKLFSGSPTKESVLLLTFGAATMGAGLTFLISARRRPGRRRRSARRHR